MLYECNFPRMLALKYGPVAVAMLLLFGLIPQLVINHSGDAVDLLVGISFPAAIVIGLLILFAKALEKLKYVAIGKSKIVVKRKGKEVEYTWLDVEKISLNRFLSLYRLKLKNGDEIYFTPYGVTTWLTGDDSDMGVIIQKMKNDLQI